jgi:hypothetical protein
MSGSSILVTLNALRVRLALPRLPNVESIVAGPAKAEAAASKPVAPLTQAMADVGP